MSITGQEFVPLQTSIFAPLLRELRRLLFGKQMALAAAVGCTEAAISYWENGKRAPDGAKFPAIVSVLSEAGASPAVLSQLRLEWERARLARPSHGLRPR